MITNCANQKKKYCSDLEYSVTSVVTSKKVHGLCGYDCGESPLNLPQYIDQSQDSINCHTTCNHKTHGLRSVFCTVTKYKSENLFLCFKYELQIKLVCNQHQLSWKHTARLETLVYQKFLTIYGNFKFSLQGNMPWRILKLNSFNLIYFFQPKLFSVYMFNIINHNIVLNGLLLRESCL